MDVYLATLGCRLNEAELEAWQRDLQATGHRLVNSAAAADFVVLNTCTVTAEAARKSRKLARRLRRENPRARLVLTGCLAQLSPSVATEIGADIVVENAGKEGIAKLLDLWSPPRAETASVVEENKNSTARRTRAFVKVQDGCRNRCTYCVVTIARGDERSRSVDEVVAEIDALVAAGRKEVVLTGAHLGGYGADIGADLRSLVATILERTTIPRLRLSSLEPWDLPQDFWSLWSEPRLCPHLHLPLQSGSDAVLKRMARRCDTQQYRELVGAARAAIDALTITTDIIVGFPGESEADFAATMQLVEELCFAHVHVFCFSPRPNTAAASLTGQIPEPTKQHRSRRLQRLAAASKQKIMEAHRGQRLLVLWEGQGQPTASGKRRWSGLTHNYLRVETIADPDRDLENRLTITDLIDVIAGERLLGQLIDD